MINWSNIQLNTDAPKPWGLYFQDSASPQMEALVELHDIIFFYLMLILFMVSYVLFSIIINFFHKNWLISNKYLNHGTAIEILWTVSPAIVLIFIAFPSFKLLFLVDDVPNACITLNVTGVQWYWSYRYPDFATNEGECVEFDSYLLSESDLDRGQLRKLDTDNLTIVPSNYVIRLLLESSDVIHALSIPALGIKVDVYPGRINEVSTIINREGLFYGQD